MPELSRFGEVVFRSPERAWIVAPILIVLLLAPIMRRRRRRMAPITIVLRGLVMLALAAVLADPVLPERETLRGRVLVLADVSPSVGDRGRAESAEMLGTCTESFDLLPFGATPDRLVEDAAPGTRLDPDERNATDIAAALRYAALRQREDRPLRVVLLSDGRATEPGVRHAARRLREGGIQIFAIGVPSPAGEGGDTQIALESLRLPPLEERRTPFAITAAIRASTKRFATAALYFHGNKHRSIQVELEPGLNEVQFPGLNLEPGRYLAQVLVGEDVTPLDDIASVHFVVPGTPRVLCLAGKKRKALIADALKAQEFEVEVVTAGERDFDGVDAVILLPDAPVAALEKQAAELSEFVGRGGGGLLAIGGSEGPGLGRLIGSPISFLLPLEIEPRAEDEQPETPEQKSETPRIKIEEQETEAYPITLCLVIDRSGSMYGQKMERAKAAASGAAYALTHQDRVAVISFGDDARVDVPPSAAGDPAAVMLGLGGLQAGGRTSLFPALQLASQVLDDESNPIRHIVLISDGVPTDNGPWRSLIGSLVQRKITLSAVGIGFETDSRLLVRFASWGRGRFWSANQPYQIPQVVTQDALRIVEAREKRKLQDTDQARPKPPEDEQKPPEEKKPPSEEPGTPTDPAEPVPTFAIVANPAAPREMLKGIEDDDLPEVAGVEKGEPRFASWIAARAGDDEGPPLVAYWRVGLGTAAVLATDPEATGNRTLRESELFPQMIAQLLRSILPDSRGDPFVLERELHGDLLRLRLMGEDGTSRTDLPLELRMDGEPVPLVRRAGMHVAALPVRSAPARIDISVGIGEDTLFEAGFIVPPSVNPELARTGVDREALLRLTADAARLDRPLPEIFEVPAESRPFQKPVSLPFLLLAAILLPIDAWARRTTQSASR